MNLLIVESPGKLSKIQKILGDGWRVMASSGHVRDLPGKGKGIGVAPPDFVPHYVPTDRGHKTLADLAQAVKKADTVYLATDPDREGEAIAWHLADALKLSNPKRVTFNEITEKAVREAVASPRTIDMQLVKAQEARRVLDRLVGFEVRGPLSNIVGNGVRAGRVQSPALRLVVDREKAIQDFKSVTHYGVELTFEAVDHAVDGWRAQWNSRDWLSDGQDYFLDREIAEQITGLRNLTVTAYQESESKQAPPAPFITSSLQQAASNALKISPKRTMELAQALYESGSITYMRTDSPNLSEEAITDIRNLASQNDWPMPATPRTWKSKDGAQEAHEAIRPSHFEIEEVGANADEKALYRLIRIRALASQLEDAVFAVSSVTLEAEVDGRKVIFEGRGRRLISPGWRAVLPNDQVDEPEDETEAVSAIPKLREGSQAVAVAGKLLIKKTKPAARFTEASLIRELEKLGIGRPSTYAATLDKLASAKFVKQEKRQLAPTDLGERIIAALKGRFGFLDYDFTRSLETRLDDIAGGQTDYLTVVSSAYGLLEKELKSFVLETGHKCPDCGRPLHHLVKRDPEPKNSYDYWRCTGGQECKASFVDDDGRPGGRKGGSPAPLTDFLCPKCGKALGVRRGQGKNGKPYELYGCSGYPDCTAKFWGKDGQPDFDNSASR